MTGVLVLVTGTGRSGTSTISGTLHHLGLHVPGPYLGANPSNPRGFFESSWAVSFHKAIETRADIEDFDGRPQAIERARQAITSDDREKLRAWLREQQALSSQIVVKDPRSVWAQRLWRDAAADVGLSIGYISMLRHPAEVVGSRSAYYATGADASRRRHYEVASVARWVNSSLVTERETRGERRTFVPYADLLTDWRAVMGRVGRELGLSYDADLAGGSHHAVDEFIDPSLRRVRVGWEDLDVPTQLRQIAQDAWDLLMSLSTGDGSDRDVMAKLDALSDAYAGLYLDSRAICNDAVDAAGRAGRREGIRRGRQRERARKVASQGGVPKDSATVGERVREVAGHHRARMVGGRLARGVLRFVARARGWRRAGRGNVASGDR